MASTVFVMSHFLSWVVGTQIVIEYSILWRSEIFHNNETERRKGENALNFWNLFQEEKKDKVILAPNRGSGKGKGPGV